MAFVNTDQAVAPPCGGSFVGDNWTAYRAFSWGINVNLGKPVAPGTNEFSGVAGSDGKFFFEAVPGRKLALEANVAAGQTITAGNLYALNATTGQLTSTAGTAFKALETLSGGGTGATAVIQAEVWKPKG